MIKRQKLRCKCVANLTVFINTTLEFVREHSSLFFIVVIIIIISFAHRRKRDIIVIFEIFTREKYLNIILNSANVLKRRHNYKRFCWKFEIF